MHEDLREFLKLIIEKSDFNMFKDFFKHIDRTTSDKIKYNARAIVVFCLEKHEIMYFDSIKSSEIALKMQYLNKTISKRPPFNINNNKIFFYAEDIKDFIGYSES